jgi:MerR family transcriptional regulator, redox-sensitive transcriptional activator SoxR
MTPRALSSEERLSIGDVVRNTGKAASTIRYYEEIGLIAPPERISGRRRYRTEIVRDLAIIDTAQRAGLSLDEIRLLLDASPHDRRSTERLREVAERKLPELNEAIARAQVVLGWLEDAALCHCPTLDDCPLFDEPTRLPRQGAPARAKASL